MENILDEAKYLRIDKKFLHCVPVNENPLSKITCIRKGTTNRCYFSEIVIDEENIPIIFVSNGAEAKPPNKRVNTEDLIDSGFTGARNQNYDKYYVSEIDGKRCIVTIADELMCGKHNGRFNAFARKMRYQHGNACTISSMNNNPHLEIEEESPDGVSAKDVLEKVASYESLSEEIDEVTSPLIDEMTRLLEEIIRLHNEIERIDPTFFLPEHLRNNRHCCEEELKILYQSYLEAVSRYSELDNDVENKQAEINLQIVEAYINFLTVENLNGDMTIAKYFVCERRSPDDDVIKIHSLGPRDDTIIVKMNHDTINKFIEGAKRLKRFLGYFPLEDIDYIIGCAKQRHGLTNNSGYQEIKEYIEHAYNLNYHFIGKTEDGKPYNDRQTRIGELRNIYKGDVYSILHRPRIHILINYILRGYSYEEIKKLYVKTQDPQEYQYFRYNMRTALRILSKIIILDGQNNVVSFPPLKRLLRKTDLPIVGRGGNKKT